MKESTQKQNETPLEQVQQEVNRGREPWFTSKRRTRVLAIIYTAEFLLFSLLATFVYFHPVIAIDVTITREFQENQSPWLKAFMVAVSFLGNQFLLFNLLILLTAIVFWYIHLRLEAIMVVGLSAVSAIVNLLLKIVINRPRPTTRLVDVFQYASGKSFPSGHVMSYVAYWGLLFSFALILLNRKSWWHYVLLIVPALFVILVVPSRIYLGDHWASDVLGGYLFGGLLLGLTLWLYQYLKSTDWLEHRMLAMRARRKRKKEELAKHNAGSRVE